MRETNKNIQACEKIVVVFFFLLALAENLRKLKIYNTGVTIRKSAPPPFVVKQIREVSSVASGYHNKKNLSKL